MTKLKTRKEIKRAKNLIVPIAFDDIFKVVFGREENADITAYLISLLLKIPYEKVKGKIKFKSTSHNKRMVNEKNSEKDIVFIVDLSEPLKINLEMNRCDSIEQTVIDRNTYFLANLFGSGLRIKNEYKEIKTTIQYNFNLDYVDKLSEELVDEYLYRNIRGHVLTEKNKIVHINIYKMAKLWYSNEYKKFKEISPILFGISALILETDKNKFEKLVESIKMDKEIKEQLERVVMDLNIDDELVTKYYDLEEERRKMNEAIMDDKIARIEKERKEIWKQEGLKEGIKQGIEQGIEKGIEQGIEQGILKNKMDMVINMYNKNYDINTIADLTTLTEEEVNKIISEL